MKERPPYIKTQEVLVTDYYYNLTEKEKRDIQNLLIRLGYMEKVEEQKKH